LIDIFQIVENHTDVFMKLKMIPVVLVFLLMSMQANGNHANLPLETRDSNDAAQGNTILQTESINVPATKFLWLFGGALIGFVAISRRTNL
jgi:hypothetical protein